MKKFEFSLGRMLDYRQSLLEKEKNTLMQLFAKRNSIEDEIEENEGQRRETAEELRALTEKGTTITEIQRLNYRLEAIRRRAKRLIQDMQDTELAIEEQREVVTESSQTVKSLELLRDNQREEYDYASRKEEEERIAELISSKIAREMQGNN
ncbi:MAG: flagellar export protein FliJ [Angelakisella sp.]